MFSHLVIFSQILVTAECENNTAFFVNKLFSYRFFHYLLNLRKNREVSIVTGKVFIGKNARTSFLTTASKASFTAV